MEQQKEERGKIVYQLRGIDPVFWRKIKTKAASEGSTVKFIILDLLKKWLKGDLNIQP